MAKFQFNGVEKEIDGTDIDFVKRYEKQREKLTHAFSTDSDDAVEILIGCEQAMRNFFDAVVEKGLFDRMFKGKPRSVKEYARCFIVLNNAIEASGDELGEIAQQLHA